MYAWYLMQALVTMRSAVSSRAALGSAAAILVAVLLSGAAAGAASEFGNPPSGEIPILYNDHTVYAKPDLLKRSRVLAALVKDGQIYVPLRSMFEQMGATVTATADGKTVTADKPGVSVSVTVGSASVTINGEKRPLDVPPMVYHGVVLVPVRVLSEALGAYVLWVHDKRLVVIRYIPALVPPPPTAAPTAPPTAPPTATPSPSPSPTPFPTIAPYQGFIQAAFTHARNVTEFTTGAFCPQSYLISGAYAPSNSAFAVKIDFRQDAYVTNDSLVDGIGNHYTRFPTIDGGTALTPVFLAKQTSLDARLEYQIGTPKIFIGAGYIHTANNYGSPKLNGFGVGLEKLPDLHSGLSFFGSGFYYPSVTGDYTLNNAASINNGKTYHQIYSIVKYDIGLTLASAHAPLYLYGGYTGDDYTGKTNAPSGQTHDGPYIGLGLKF